MSSSSSNINDRLYANFGFPPSSWNLLYGLTPYSAAKRDKLSVLAFEVANTIIKGLNLRQSLLDENVQILKTEILHTKGVQLLVSTDIEELLRIAEADKREEFEIFFSEVARFGNMCTDPQWHNLDRLFARKFELKERREMTDIKMLKLGSLAQHTIELYHECISLDRYVQHYRQTLEEVEYFRFPQKGKSVISVIQHEINHQRKIVRNLQKKSLWSRNLEEVVEKLMTMPEIKAEMDKILHWLVPVATNTIKYVRVLHQYFNNLHVYKCITLIIYFLAEHIKVSGGLVSGQTPGK
ncbi:hypothetical protein M8C21_001740 [Ambrosia artemisiifolia]|uniref:DUF3475 domain-containing protein n=1 Tax=Ambrosia artemisiifolia TaxID=4212 RepID=A0AAD5D1S5_AMBAR|nr:hypothetical protein M8C21_001740 [Ambrosia artemisiifolia]